MPQNQLPERTAVSCPAVLAGGASTAGAGRGETLPACACRHATTEIKPAAKAKTATLWQCFGVMFSSFNQTLTSSRTSWPPNSCNSAIRWGGGRQEKRGPSVRRNADRKQQCG